MLQALAKILTFFTNPLALIVFVLLLLGSNFMPEEARADTLKYLAIIACVLYPLCGFVTRLAAMRVLSVADSLSKTQSLEVSNELLRRRIEDLEAAVKKAEDESLDARRELRRYKARFDENTVRDLQYRVDALRDETQRLKGRNRIRMFPLSARKF